MKIQEPKMVKILDVFTFSKINDDEFIENSLIENQPILLQGQKALNLMGVI